MGNAKKEDCFKIRVGLIFILLTIITITSCTSAKQLRYFNDLPDSTTIHLPLMPSDERLIQIGDRLQISIGARDEAAAEVFNRYGGIVTSGSNPAGGGTSGSQSNSELSGYLIDYDGKVEFPIIGRVKAEGLTSRELKDSLTKLVTPYLRDPLVSVRFMTFKFTVLGEVKAPGVFNLPMQRTTLLDALGQAGDLPHSAKRSIEIYRDYNGQRIVTKIDLRKKDVLYNPDVFIIRHNDVIYVQPRESRLFSEEAKVYLGLITLMISTLTLIITFTTR
jgi:polysaccharide export outer membrane protein